jgi:hypothetical protein
MSLVPCCARLSWQTRYCAGQRVSTGFPA